MNGKEALKRLVDGNLNEVNYYRQFCDSTTHIMKDKEIIEKDLEASEIAIDFIDRIADLFQEHDLEELEDKITKTLKVLEIIKKKRFAWEMATASLSYYNERVIPDRRLTETEFNLIKEWYER